MENYNTDPHAFCKIAKLTVLGSVFVGVGALLNHTVPAFRAPVRWVDKVLQKTGNNLAAMPGTHALFRHNPLSENTMVREFLAINIVESALIGGLIVGTGTAMKYAGIKPKTVEQWLASNSGDHARS